MAKVLLHTCCAPCLIYPYARLTEEENEVTSFFYNPNIHPFNEYQERLRSVKKCCEELNISIIIGDYDLKEYFRRVSFHENKRCLACYDLRLRKTAEEARERGFDA
ncbi:MAG: epoxyqueuosine reductase QueH, partial [Candidatus Subteraquimicrobiales bacterium]|nr:epoxyqueuosine reductase QueH [Candidatus Subteraquimicrobiales bacterium]